MGLEQTPKAEETPELFPDPFEPEAEPTGNTASCYLCGRDFSRLSAEHVIRRNYEYDARRDKKDRPKMVRYFMSFCIWCAHSNKL
jgi:hypothetical protein